MFSKFLRKGFNNSVSVCLNWRNSLVCLDLNGEMYNTTAGYRHKFSNILRLSPCNKETLRFNILSEITEENAFHDAYIFADVFLAQVDSKIDLSSKILVDYAKDLLACAILHCKCSDLCNKSMNGVLSFLSYICKDNENDKYNYILNNMIDNYHCSDEIHEIICNSVQRLKLLSGSMLENIFSLVLNSIRIFDDPLIRDFSSSSDFCINDFNVFDRPISLFITVPFSYLNMVFPYISIIIKLIDRLYLNNKTNMKNPVIMIFDEYFNNAQYLKNNNYRNDNLIFFTNIKSNNNILVRFLYRKKINLPVISERNVFLNECANTSKPDLSNKQWYDVPEEKYMHDNDTVFEPIFTSRIPTDEELESEEYKKYFNTDNNTKSKNNLKDIEFIKHQNISDIDLFYNNELSGQLNVLEKSLQFDEFNKIKHRFSIQGKKCGFICMLHGESGAGKTEAVLQLARRTKRDLLKLDISIIRKTRVGRSEKAVNRVFSGYKKIYEKTKNAPILFINEADGLFQTRTGDIENSTNKTLALDFNTIQNLLLDKLECFDGIMIGTSNFIENIDKAFERRILFKIKFNKPDKETQKKIWKSKMKDLDDETIEKLTNKFNFTGGIIDNVIKKRDIDFILSGEEANFENLEILCKMEYQEKDEKKIGFNA